MKSIKATLGGYEKPFDGPCSTSIICNYADAMTTSRKAAYREHLHNMYAALKEREARMAPQPVSEITDAQRAEHLQHANALRGVLKAHGIDPQDWDACMNYLCDGSGLRYMVKIYVDYVYNCTEPGISAITAQLLGYDPALPGSERTVIHPLRSDQEQRATLSKAMQRAGKLDTFPRGKCAHRMADLGWEFYK